MRRFRYWCSLLIFIFASLLTLTTVGQTKNLSDTIHRRKVYVVSGFGFGFPLAKTAEVLTERFSSNIGLDISLLNRRYFLYPSIDFVSLRYAQMEQDSDYEYTNQGARNNAYNFHGSIGIRRQLNRLNLYAFSGPGIGYFEEPRAEVDEAERHVRIVNEIKISPSFKVGVGGDYMLGSFFLFAESGWTHNFRKIQHRPFNQLTLFVGLKTDVTRLANKVVDVVK